MKDSIEEESFLFAGVITPLADEDEVVEEEWRDAEESPCFNNLRGSPSEIILRFVSAE